MQKAYVRGSYESVDDFLADAERIGCTDKTDLALFVNALDTLRVFGTEPQANGAARPDVNRPASPQMMSFLRNLADEKRAVLPDYELTNAQALKIRDALKAGTYNADDYTVPF